MRSSMSFRVARSNRTFAASADISLVKARNSAASSADRSSSSASLRSFGRSVNTATALATRLDSERCSRRAISRARAAIASSRLADIVADMEAPFLWQQYIQCISKSAKTLKGARQFRCTLADFSRRYGVPRPLTYSLSPAAKCSYSKRTRGVAFMSSCMTSQISSGIGISPANSRISSGERLAMFSWQPPMPTPARSAASCAGSLSQRKPKSTRARAWPQGADRAKRAVVAVEADQAMVERARRASRASRNVRDSRVGEEADAGLADAPRDQRALGRADHAHRDVGVAAQKILVAIGQREFDRRRRGLAARERREHRGQHFAADDLARGDADDAVIRRGFARGGARKRRRGRRHRLDMRREIEAASVGVRPRCERVNSASPSAASRASICRPTVGCARPSRRPAPDRLRSRMTSRKVRNSSQCGSRRVIPIVHWFSNRWPGVQAALSRVRWGRRRAYLTSPLFPA